jgi:hypothetical protein
VDPSNANIVYITYTDFNPAGGPHRRLQVHRRGATWARNFLIGDRSRPLATAIVPAARASNGWIYVGYQEYNTRTPAARRASATKWPARPTAGHLGRHRRTGYRPGRGLFERPGRARHLLHQRRGSSFARAATPIMGSADRPKPRLHGLLRRRSGKRLHLRRLDRLPQRHPLPPLHRRRRHLDGPAKINTDPQGKDQYYPG